MTASERIRVAYEEASEVYHAVMEKLNERLEEIEDV
jgi:hypothetical protein